MKREVILKVILAAALLVIGFLGTGFGQSKDESLRLYQQGQQAYQYGRYEEALRYFERSLKIDRSLDDAQGIAANLNNIGAVYKSLGQYDKALRYFEEALEIDRKLNIPKEIAIDLNNIGAVYDDLGQYDKALKYYEEALKIRKELNIPQYIATSLNNIGAVYYFLGQYDKALKYYEEALKIRKELNIPQYIATSLNNIGLVYKSLGQYDKALKYYDEALKIRKELNIPQDIATSLNNIGLVYDSLGQYDKALKYYDEALEIKRKHNLSPQSIATTLNNIGLVYYSLGQYDKALKYYDEALEICRELNIPQYIAASLNNIGLVYLSLKDYKKAEERFKEAEKEYAKTEYELKGNPGMVEFYLVQERNNEALRLLEEMTPRWFDDPPYQIQYYTQKGLGFKGVGKLKDASGEFLSAVLMIEEMRQRVKGERIGFFGAGGYGGRTRPYQGLVSALSERAIKGEKEDKRFIPYGRDLTSSAFYFSESTKARVLLELMAESERQRQKTEIPEDLRKREENLINQLSAIDAQWEDAYKKGEETLKNLKERKDKLTSELNSLIKELRKNYPKYASLYYPKPIPPEELPLKDDEVLLEYAITDDAGYLFIVRKGGVKRIVKIHLGRERLEEQVKTFVEPLNIDQYQNFSTKKAKELYDILLAEALKDMGGNEEIIIIPDGILGLLPFEALVIKEGAGVKESIYVGDRYNLTYYQSATILALQRRLKGESAQRPLFALGNPIYNKEDIRYLSYKEKKPEPILLAKNNQTAFRALATRREWGKTGKDDKEGSELIYPILPETEEEVKAIAGLFNISPTPPDVLLGILANETNLRKSPLKDYRYLHFATHADLPGKVQGINEPFILLSQVENEGEDDGFLTLSEVLGLNLNADMVVLSACLTGRGKMMEGEGVANFARAFHHAGAKSVLVSLWEVSSKETVEYMKLFYSYLKEEKTRAEALRLSREKIKVKYPNPYFWAPFILHGEGER